MTRAVLAHLAAVVGLGAGFAAGLAFAEVGWATLAFAATLVLGAVVMVLAVVVARRLDHRVAARLGAIGAAVGHAPMKRGHEIDYVESIVSTLHQSLQRASAVRSAVAQSPLPLAILNEDGEIATASAGLQSLGPDFARGKSFPDFDTLAQNGELVFERDGVTYRASTNTEDGARRMVSVSLADAQVDASVLHEIGDALMAGALEAGLKSQLSALGGNGQNVIRGFEGLGAGLALMDGVLAGDPKARAAASGRNDPLGVRAKAMADQLEAFAAGREEDEETRHKLESKLSRIAEVIDRHRAMAARLRDSAEELRTDGAALEALIDGGLDGAQAAHQLGAAARSAVNGAKAAARINNETATSIGTLTAQISGLVTAIEEVSFRTNLIALNASVEAARAGEKGAGFAVVADEVRMLAQNATKTAKEIRALVSKSREESKQGASEAGQLEELIASLDEHLRNLSTETDRITGALSEGKSALAEIDGKAAAIASDAERATGGAHPRMARAG